MMCGFTRTDPLQIEDLARLIDGQQILLCLSAAEFAQYSTVLASWLASAVEVSLILHESLQLSPVGHSA